MVLRVHFPLLPGEMQFSSSKLTNRREKGVATGTAFEENILAC